MSEKRSSDNSITDRLIFRQRWWQHLIFWCVALVILLNIFRTSSSYEKIDLIYTCIFMIPVMAIVYLNLYQIIPRFLRRERYLLYILSFLALLGAGALFLYLLFDRWIDFFLPSYYFISYYSVPQLMLYTGSFLLMTTLLKLSRSWFLLMRVERMTASHRLKSLQSQINPHFLLNSLQTIYALSLEKSERTPGVILQLSEILKYTLYETGQQRVKLEKELNLIRDYVEMYRHRLDPARADIKLETEGDPGETEIAPMLLIPFIENSFKHGLQAGTGETFVHINIRTDHRNIILTVRNSRGGTDLVDDEQRRGIGIENTKQRLQLLYPGRHGLTIREEEGIFEVILQIETGI